MTIKYFCLIVLPKLRWRLGGKYIDYVKSYWHLVIKKRPPKWPDAVSCDLRICRYCGRNKL